MRKITVEPDLGQTIQSAAEEANYVARKLGIKVFLKFNDVELAVFPDYTTSAADTLAKEFYDKCEAKCKDYEQSDECKERQKQRARVVEELQDQIDTLMHGLPLLDFKDLDEVLRWLEDMQEPSDDTGTFVPVSVIIGAFREHGFEADMNCGEDFKKEDRENYAGWVIGQALQNLESLGAIHPMIPGFIEKWRERF